MDMYIYIYINVCMCIYKYIIMNIRVYLHKRSREIGGGRERKRERERVIEREKERTRERTRERTCDFAEAWLEICSRALLSKQVGVAASKKLHTLRRVRCDMVLHRASRARHLQTNM